MRWGDDLKILDFYTRLLSVLSNERYTYQCGEDPISYSEPDGIEYGLRNMRQLTDASGAVTMTKGYEPYGEVLSGQGSGTSSYGCTGEWGEAWGGTYLRARYYSPGVGRFLTRDTWAGDANVPMSYNAWLYTYANPINLMDPSGKYPAFCDNIPSDMWGKIPECSEDRGFTSKGNQAFQLYQLYRRSSGYWNNWKKRGFPPRNIFGINVYI